MLSVLNFVLRLWGGIAGGWRDLVLENTALRHQVDVLTRTRRRFGQNSDADLAEISLTLAFVSYTAASSADGGCWSRRSLRCRERMPRAGRSAQDRCLISDGTERSRMRIAPHTRDAFVTLWCSTRASACLCLLG